MSIVLTGLLIISAVFWIQWLWSRRKFYLASMKLPGPLAYPLIGNAIELGAFGKGHEITARIREMSKRFPSPFRMWAGLDFFIVITEPEDIEIVLTEKSASYKDKRYDLMKPCIGSGLLSASGPLWKKHRQIINPSFNKASLRSFQPIYNKHAENLVENLSKLRNCGAVEIVKYCKRCTGDVMAEALFDEKMEYYKGEKDHILKWTTAVTELIFLRMTKFWQEWDSIYKLSKEFKIEEEYMKQYRNFHYPIIRKKIEKYVEMKKNSNINNNVNDESDKVKPVMKTYTTFEVLMEALIEGKITEKEILDEYDNIYNPGMDTTYSQIGFFMMILGMHKDSQDKLWKEIKEFYKDDLKSEVLPEHFNHLPYLEMCIKELIRLFPTGPFFTRYVTEDFKLPSRNITIPAGTYLGICNFITHRNPKYWESPDSFMPERFSPEFSKSRPRCAFIPFSYGQRNCIGQNMAMDMLKTIGIYLIRNFEFKSDLTMDKLKIKFDISVRSASGYNVIITDRKL